MNEQRVLPTPFTHFCRKPDLHHRLCRTIVIRVGEFEDHHVGIFPSFFLQPGQDLVRVEFRVADKEKDAAASLLPPSVSDCGPVLKVLWRRSDEYEEFFPAATLFLDRKGTEVQFGVTRVNGEASIRGVGVGP